MENKKKFFKQCYNLLKEIFETEDLGYTQLEEFLNHSKKKLKKENKYFTLDNKNIPDLIAGSDYPNQRKEYHLSNDVSIVKEYPIQ